MVIGIGKHKPFQFCVLCCPASSLQRIFMMNERNQKMNLFGVCFLIKLGSGGSAYADEAVSYTAPKGVRQLNTNTC